MKRGKSKHADIGTLRIIGGQWRGRKLHFPATQGLRPTGDRIRETLFNWLAPVIEGAHCVDLFAGSGALGLEALSRGAESCVFIEPQRQAARAIREHLQTLHCDQGSVVEASAIDWLQNCEQAFDVIFMDPPFASDLYAPALALIAERRLLKADGRLYVECDAGQLIDVPAGYETLRDKKAGQTRYRLFGPLPSPPP